MDSKLYVIAQFDDETQDMLLSYHKMLQRHGFTGKQTKDIPYHFTLGSYDINAENQTIEKLKQVCAKTDCIDIKLSHIGLFGLKVLFIEPNVNFELLNLTRSFFPDCGNGSHPWTAHATLLIDEPEIILKALPIVAENFKPFRAKITSVSLYEFFPARFIKKCNLN
jgi:2'-5' RNA ligase